MSFICGITANKAMVFVMQSTSNMTPLFLDEHWNCSCYQESTESLGSADAFLGRANAVVLQGEMIKRKTMEQTLAASRACHVMSNLDKILSSAKIRHHLHQMFRRWTLNLVK
jgi:hypothetical protein